MRHAPNQRVLRDRHHDVLRGARRPSFHALYSGEDASVAIETLEVLAGSLPDRALRLVREWATLHRAELEADWQRARAGEPLERIPPLT